MRVIVAGLLGAIVFFFWGFVAHMYLPIGTMGMRQSTNEVAALSVLAEGAPAEGVYAIPSLAPDKMDDAAAVAAYSERAKAHPYAFVVFQPAGEDGMQMGDNLAREFVTNLLSAWLVAFILALGPFAFGKRVFIATALGLFAWLCISVPYWNWYRFPLDFTIGSLLSQVLGWGLAGAVMAWWLGRRTR